MGKESKSFSFRLPDALCTVKYSSMGREGRSHLLLCSFALSDSLYSEVLHYGEGRQIVLFALCRHATR